MSSAALPARLVDASLLVGVGVLLSTGIGSLLAGDPTQWWVIALHGIAGLALIPLVAVKLYRVRRRLRRPDRSMTSSILLAVLTLIAIGTGGAWALGIRIRAGPFLPLVVHGLVGVSVALVLLVHLRHRFHLPGSRELTDRRSALKLAGAVAIGTLAWRAQGVVNRARAVAPRRFTGSRETGSGAGNAFPVTSWVADDPAPIDPDAWTLHLDGLVETPRTFTYDELVGGGDRDETRALLDCTSGWYSTHDWQGVRGDALLETAGVEPTARWITVHSVTGYRWSLPISEARRVLFATHVDGERLAHGHGFPLRLVAPDRRGFQWVKWVDRLEVRRSRDLSQLVAVFISGFRGTAR